MEFDFEDVLDYPLPKGFHFVKSQEFDMNKIGKCCWKGFDHEMKEGMWDHQYDQNNYLIQAAPHATTELAVQSQIPYPSFLILGNTQTVLQLVLTLSVHLINLYVSLLLYVSY